MPINHEFSTVQEEGDGFAIEYTRALPLPDNGGASLSNGIDKFDVIVSGAGPSGLFLTLLLSRLGIGDESLLCVDSNKGPTPAGHADGLVSRTIEIFRTLGLEDIPLREGLQLYSTSTWSRDPNDKNKLIRTMHTPFFETAPARYPPIITIQQGWLEREFLADFKKYSKTGVAYSTKLVEVKLDASDPEYPVHAVIRKDGQDRVVRARYLVGADGARSVVRSCMTIEQEEWITDRLGGVIDLVVDSDFPDIRRLTHMPDPRPGGRGAAFTIPREKLPNGDWLLRFYIDMTDYDECGEDAEPANESVLDAETRRAKRAQVTLDQILVRARQKFHPYRFDIKKGTQPHWWAVYTFSQRLAKEFIVNDNNGEPRIFLIGDACHTHSPNQGQGMNTGLQDAYNLSWKLAHALKGICPSPRALLSTYQEERLPNARRLLRHDKLWNTSDTPRQQLMEEMAETLTCCGIEYGPNMVITRDESLGDDSPVKGTAFLRGILRPGRRLLNAKLERFADGAPWDLQDDLLSNGRYRILVISGMDFPTQFGRSVAAIDEICTKVIPSFTTNMVELIVLQPHKDPEFHWVDMPACLKDHAEMRTYIAEREVYETYGVDVNDGAVVVIRPDGIVGMYAALGDIASVDAYLSRLLLKV